MNKINGKKRKNRDEFQRREQLIERGRLLQSSSNLLNYHNDDCSYKKLCIEKMSPEQKSTGSEIFIAGGSVSDNSRM